MKMMDLPSRIKFYSLWGLFAILIFGCAAYRHFYTYDNMKVEVVDNARVEYGSANYQLKQLIKDVDGEIISIKKDIDPNVVGIQEAVVEVKKNRIVKNIPITVSVVDTTSPVIQLKQDKMTITQGENCDLFSMIDFVKDQVDGDISYLDQIDENSNFYYHFDYDSNTIENVGEHEISIKAKDKNGNVSMAKFILEVLEPVPVEPEYNYVPQPVYDNVAPNPQGGDLVSIAYSLVGSPYISGSNGPYGFDCSGFVQYVYAQAGMSVSRSSSSQYYEGVGVSYDNALPGDILSWGFVDGSPTHSALYIGDGKMIHATNPNQGVIVSDVAGWTRGSGSHVIAVRRVQ